MLTELNKFAQQLRIEDPLQEELFQRFLKRDPAVTGIIDFKLYPKLSPFKADKENPPLTWEFVVQKHEAKRAGTHYDLRLGDPKSGYGYSWALRYFPENPGEKNLAIEQPVHSLDYFNFEGSIPEGYYGAGKVSIVYRGKVDVISMDNDHIKFVFYDGPTTKEFLLLRQDGKRWLCINITDHRDNLPDVPSDRKKYKEIPMETALSRYINENYIFSRKDDGVQIIYYFKPNGQLKIFSPRESILSETGLIEHTYKFYPYGTLKFPEFKNSIFRGELFAVDKKTGKAIPINDIIRISHNQAPTARELLKKYNWVPRLTVFDVVQWKGVPVEDNLPYAEKLRILETLAKRLKGVVEIPTYVQDPNKKIEFVKAIQSGQIPETEEGIVIQNLNEPETPKKAKFQKEYDVYVRNIFESSSPSWQGLYAGGIEYSLTPDGPIVGRVGAGFDLATRHDMLVNKEKYIGRIARIRGAGQFASGAIRKPVFVAWHPEKGKEWMLKEAKTEDPWEKWHTVLIDAPYGRYTKGDIYQYYSLPHIKYKLFEDIKDNPVIVIQSFTKNAPVLKRNIEGRKIIITKSDGDEDNPASLDYWLLKRTVEFHKTLGASTDMYIVDVDAGEQVTFDEVKRVTYQLAQFLKKLPEVKDIETRFSGGTGFYIIAHLVKEMPIEEAREKLKEHLRNFIAETGEIGKFTITTKPGAGQIRLDTSPMKFGGSIRAMFSINMNTGLISIPVKLKNLLKFDPFDAHPSNFLAKQQ